MAAEYGHDYRLSQSSTQKISPASSQAPQQMSASSRAPQQYETPGVGGGHSGSHSNMQSQHGEYWMSFPETRTEPEQN